AIYTLSLHDALPICEALPVVVEVEVDLGAAPPLLDALRPGLQLGLRVVAAAPAPAVVEAHERPVRRDLVRDVRALRVVPDGERRSEEHTSELQSRSD